MARRIIKGEWNLIPSLSLHELHCIVVFLDKHNKSLLAEEVIQYWETHQ